MGKAGAPSKYKAEYCQRLLDYFSIEPYEVKVVEVATAMGVQPIKKEVANNFPTLSKFAIDLGVSSLTVSKWAKEYPEFGEVYEMVKDYQAHFLLTNGLRGLIDKTVMIFTAKNTIGFRDKMPEEKDDFNINITLADEIAKARARATKAKDKESEK